MTDTAQPVAAENGTLEQGAEAFKAFLEPQPEPKRDDAGRYAPAETDEDQAEVEEPADNADGEDQGEADDADEAAEAAQLDDAPMPASWSKEDEEVWQQLPPEAQAKIVEREGQREAAVNQKFQETANARKAAEQQAAEANANRDNYARAITEVVSLIDYPEPNPAEYGLGTEYYNRDGYDLAVYQWRQNNATIQTLLQQRQNITAQQDRDQKAAREQAFNEIEQDAWPKFVADVPELKDPAKAQQFVSTLIDYGIRAGIPQDAFVKGSPNQATSREMHLLWKASEYDRIKAAGKRVNAGNPPPKPAAPAVRPGGVATRQSVQRNRLNGAMDRLAKSGSVEDGAAVFKHLFK